MATLSTKRRRKGAQTKAKTQANASTRSDGAPHEISERVWTYASVALIVVAAFLRLYDLEIKPFHHDEGVNGFFLTNLIRQGEYRYDPTNYHGPTLYYFSLPFAQLFGLKTWAVRLVPVLFGVATVWLVLCLRRYVGAIAALAAAALVVFSPGAVFFSRYFIHEMIFVATALGAVVSLLYFYDTARTRYLMLGSASLALHFATKETHFITFGVIALAALVAWGWAAYMRGRVHPFAPRGTADTDASGGGFSMSELIERLGGRDRALTTLFGALALFALISAVFYSSFFTNWKGVSDSLEALKVWTKTGTGEIQQPIHIHPWHKYVSWLLAEEAPTLILGAIGSALALWAGRNRFAIFSGAWGFGALAAYSLVPYKTPWLVLNFTIPMAIAAGYGVQSLYVKARRATDADRFVIASLLLIVAAGVFDATRKLSSQVKPEDFSALKVLLVAAGAVAVWYVFNLYKSKGGGAFAKGMPSLALAGLALLFSAYQMWILNFKEYDNDQYPYVYAHTRRGFLHLVSEINSLAARAGTATDTRIAVASPGPGADSYWPLPWYLNKYKSVGYHNNIPTGGAQTTIIVGNATQDAQLRTALATTHRKVGDIFPLRPGVDLVLYARRDIPFK